MSIKLTKSKGTTKDTLGCEFHYTRLGTTETIEEYNNGEWNVEVKQTNIYYCNEFPETEAPTLKELKIKMGKL